MKKPIRFLLLVPLVAIAGVFGVARLRPKAVVASPVVRGVALDAVYATGTVEAEDRVTIKAKTTGSILELLVREGAAVKKGQLLARIDNAVLTYELERGKADLSAASAQGSRNAPQVAALRGQWTATHAELDSARHELLRIEKLVATGAISTAELDRARALVAQIEGTLAANEAQQRSLRIDLSANSARQSANVQSLSSRLADTEVRAPIDGVVLARYVDPGEVVSVNAPVFKVGDTSRLILEVSVDEADIGRVHDGRTDLGHGGAHAASAAAVSLYAYAKQVFRGHVFEILPDANRDRKVFIAKVRLDEPPSELRSGMSAEVNIVADTHANALLVPAEGVEDGQVWVVDDGRAHRRKIEVGVHDLIRVEALSGVGQGDLVVVDGRDGLSEGARVSATIRQPDKLAPLPDATQPTQTSVAN